MKCMPSFDADKVTQNTFGDELAEVKQGVTSFSPTMYDLDSSLTTHPHPLSR